MRHLNKKAISNLLASVSLVLLTIFAVAAVGVAFNKIISAPTFSPELSCLELQSNLPIKMKSACFNEQTQKVEVTLQRSLKEFEIPVLNFKLSSKTESSAWVCKPDCCDCDIVVPGATKTYYLELENLPEQSEMNLNVLNCFVHTKEIKIC